MIRDLLRHVAGWNPVPDNNDPEATPGFLRRAASLRRNTVPDSRTPDLFDIESLLSEDG